MNENLKLITDNRGRLYYLRFSKERQNLTLDDYTKPRSFIIEGVCEIYANKLYEMLVKIANKLQDLNPKEIKDLCELNISGSYVKLFTPFYKKYTGYRELKNGMGIYSGYCSSARIAYIIKQLLVFYEIDLDKCYLIIKEKEYHEPVTNRNADKESEVNKLEEFVNKNFVDSELIYQTIIEVVDYVNQFTKYNLYTCIAYSDFNIAVLNFIDFEYKNNKKYSVELIRFATNILAFARFRSLYLLDAIEYKFTYYIQEDGKKIHVQMHDVDYLEAE